MKTEMSFTIFTINLLLSLSCFISLTNALNEYNKEDLCDRVREFIDGNTRSSRTAILRNVFLWPYGIVPYEIDPSLSKYKKYIFDAINDYQANSCIRFVKRKAIHDNAYIQFTSGQNSDVGRNGFEPNIISLGPGCFYKATIVHEIGHALGFVHEHQRSDRDEHIVIHIDNVDGNNPRDLLIKKRQFTKNDYNQDCNLTEYDIHSVMHYGKDAFAKKSKVTISTDKEGAATLTSPMEKYGLSKLDIFAVNVLYCEHPFH